ncbi:hypothetical protein FO519_010440, partial [Halicephalobus sp. NKZ332]
MVLCFWDKEDLNYLPLYKSIPPPTEDQLDKYVRRIIKDKGYEDDKETKSCLEGHLRQSESNWIAVISEKDKEKMREIKDESNQIEAFKMIEEFLNMADEITVLLIYYRALRLEDFICDSLPTFVGYVSEKRNHPENSSQIYQLSLLFNFISVFEGRLQREFLDVHLHPKILNVCEQRENGRTVKTDCWTPEIVCIRPSSYVDNLERIPVARIANIDDNDVPGNPVEDEFMEFMEESNPADRLSMNWQHPEVEDESDSVLRKCRDEKS